MDGGLVIRFLHGWRVRLFDEIERRHTGPAKYAQPYFDFLNKSARSAAKVVRDVLEQWFAQFPTGARADLAGRFRSPDNRAHLGAFFELYLYTLFQKLGFRVEVHLGTHRSAKKPDFLLRKGDDVFYLEATLAAPSDKDTAAELRANRVYDIIDQMDSPNFFVGVEVAGQGTSDPPARKIRNFLAKQLERLDPDAIAVLVEQRGIDALPKWRIRCQDWEIVFSPIPKSPDGRGQPGLRPIGYRMLGPKYVDSREGIVAAIAHKAKKYGLMDVPYVVTINIIDEFVDETDVVDALFGQEVVVVRHLVGGAYTTEVTRKRNGIWRGPAGAQNTRVSAVIVTDKFSYWSVGKRSLVMWHNPWALGSAGLLLGADASRSGT